MASTLSPLTQALTGAVGAASANALAYPLDLVTTRLQMTKSRKLKGLTGAAAVLQDTARKHGIGALYDGLDSDTASTIISNFLYFYAYTLLRTLVARRASRQGDLPQSTRTPTTLPVAQELLLGFIAGISSRMITSPFSVLTVRLQTSRDDEENGSGKGIIAAARSIYRDEGLEGFWKGFQSTILLSMNPAITFACLQFIRRLLQLRPNLRASASKITQSGPLETFFTAALANTAAVSLLYPFILAKTRLQVERKKEPSAASEEGSRPSPRPTMASILVDAYTGKDGFPGGLYQGLPAQIAKGVITMGVTITVKERIEQGLVRAVRRWRN